MNKTTEQYLHEIIRDESKAYQVFNEETQDLYEGGGSISITNALVLLKIVELRKLNDNISAIAGNMKTLMQKFN